jgi:hypothetical protein
VARDERRRWERSDKRQVYATPTRGFPTSARPSTVETTRESTGRTAPECRVVNRTPVHCQNSVVSETTVTKRSKDLAGAFVIIVSEPPTMPFAGRLASVGAVSCPTLRPRLRPATPVRSGSCADPRHRPSRAAASTKGAGPSVRPAVAPAWETRGHGYLCKPRLP